ncbi:hypothetical protein BDF20DRAFT_846191 [Mycotypha africana]|uniref:uncharacterized protein n=1 Tax=Mycotypha africana TaxID=64632 RepID=UPI0023002DB2|nr:uncharacterized protein BDF20DRAFT_846191 [Mycotypha africana]KAI8991744.1 hypothetical protein BDF20DRAFT_846191 [Mycotypha africana]
MEATFNSTETPPTTVRPRHFLIRMISLSRRRILASKFTKLFVCLLCLTTLLCIVLEANIIHSHVKVYQDLVNNKSIQDVPSTSVDPDHLLSSLSEQQAKQLWIALGLRRLKNENVFFILFSLFQLVLGLDAVRYFHVGNTYSVSCVVIDLHKAYLYRNILW